jgi:regulator of replication initiation timing
MDMAGRIESVLRRNAQIERENAELRQELAHPQVQAKGNTRSDVLREVERMLTERGVR